MGRLTSSVSVLVRAQVGREDTTNPGVHRGYVGSVCGDVAVTVAVNAAVSSPHRPPNWVLGHRGSGRTALRGAVTAHDAAKQEPDAMR